MPPSEPESGKNEEPANLADYTAVRHGEGTPDQIAKVLNALTDEHSPLYLALGETATWARMMIGRKYGIPVPAGKELWPAYKNFLTVCDFLREKQQAGILSEREVAEILNSSRSDLLDMEPATPSIYAMYVTRTIRAIKALRPDLSTELRNLPISRKR